MKRERRRQKTVADLEEDDAILKKRCPTNSISMDPTGAALQNGSYCIEDLPKEVLAKIFQCMDFKDRLKAELVSRKWNTLLRTHGWREFNQCHLNGNISSEKVYTLFKRCGAHLKELLIVPVTSSEGRLYRRSVQPVVEWLHLLKALTGLCISHRQLEEKQLELIAKFANLQAVHLEGCFDKFRDPLKLLDAIGSFLAKCTSLRSLSLSKVKPWSPVGQSFINAPSFSLPASLRLLGLDDSFPISSIVKEAAQNCSQLQGLSLSFQRPLNGVVLPLHGVVFQVFESEALFQRLRHFELSFRKEPSKEVLQRFKKALRWMKNLRSLSATHIDGEMLEEIVRRCPHLEQFKYLTHSASLLDSFASLARLKHLAVFCASHYSSLRPRETPQVVQETLASIAANGELEYLSVNVKLTMEFALQIVTANPKLAYLEFAQPPSNLHGLVSTVANSRTSTSSPILHFRIPFAQWRKNRERGRIEYPKLKLCYQAPLEETALMKAHLQQIFNGHAPDFLLRCHPVHFDEEDDC